MTCSDGKGNSNNGNWSLLKYVSKFFSVFPFSKNVSQMKRLKSEDTRWFFKLYHKFFSLLSWKYALINFFNVNFSFILFSRIIIITMTTIIMVSERIFLRFCKFKQSSRSQLVNRPSNTKIRPQVKQARAANKNGRCTGTTHSL